MDTGILNNFRSPYMFHPEDPLTPEELCWIMDNMTALEVKLYSQFLWHIINGIRRFRYHGIEGQHSVNLFTLASTIITRI